MKTTATRGLPSELHPEQRLNIDQVQALVGWGRSKTLAEVKAGAFPQPERDGRRCTRWRAGDVLVWLDLRRQTLQQSSGATRPSLNRK